MSAGLAAWGRLWPLPFLPAFYAAIIWAAGDLRPEHVAAAILCLGLAAASDTTRRWLVLAVPGILVATGYDVLRYVRPLFVTPDRVLGCGLREVELALFPAGQGLTFPDLAARHHAPWLDLVVALPYGLFWIVVVAYAVRLFLADPARMSLFLWAVAIAHLLAFAVWLALPAAPPWYIRAHGCVIDTAVPPSAAALLRVDALLGIDYFRSFYSRGPTVFGALPSMHNAFAMLGLLSGWAVAGRGERGVHLAYVAAMAFASVYTDHHWIVDVIAGWVVAALGVALARVILAARPRGPVTRPVAPAR